RTRPPSIRTWLDDDVFQWLCACAVYPRLEWHLTLHIAMAIDPAGRLLHERKLLQLIRLPWFRDGQIPAAQRAWLLKHLAPEYEASVRMLIVDALERNRAPEGSYARDDQEIQLAAQRYALRPSGRTAANLHAALDGAPEVDIAEDPL